MTRICRLLLLIVLCILAEFGFAAEQKFGDYIVHYNAFAADFLSPAIASNYGLTRSRNRAVLNITVQQENSDGDRVAVDAQIQATAVDAYQKLRPLELRRVIDTDAIYQLAEFTIINAESINFTIDVSVENQSLGTITFKQQFFTD